MNMEVLEDWWDSKKFQNLYDAEACEKHKGFCALTEEWR